MEYAIERLIVIYVTRNFIEVIFILEKNRLKAVCSPNGGDEGSRTPVQAASTFKRLQFSPRC
jgi:hypothetical protein